ncbi:hypothetical protein AHAS_Ahas01G0122600 [Arachis hypogaea]
MMTASCGFWSSRQKGLPAQGYEDFAACFPSNEYRYAIYDFEFLTEVLYRNMIPSNFTMSTSNVMASLATDLLVSYFFILIYNVLFALCSLLLGS